MKHLWLNLSIIAVVIGLLCVCGCTEKSPRSAADFFVAPDGSNANPGTAEKPFATLDRARRAVRELSPRPDRDITVLIREGSYPIHETVVFGLEDSPRNGHRIIYTAEPGKTVEFYSTLPVTGWTKTSQPPRGLPDAAHDRLWQADLPEGVDNVYALYDNASVLPRARSKGCTVTNELSSFQEFLGLWDDRESFKRIHLPADVLTSLHYWPGMEAVIRATVTWTMNILPVKAVHADKGYLETATPATYPLGKLGNAVEGDTVWLENIPQALDEPGEWIVNPQTRKIYLWPKSDADPGASIQAGRLVEMIRIEGKIDYDGPADTPAGGITFRGLTFTRNGRYTWPLDHTGRGLQHDWEMFDAPSAALRLRAADNCTIENCTFTNLRTTAIRLDLHAQNNRIAYNTFDNIGGVGVLLSGYGPGTKDVNKNNIVEDNRFSNVGTVYWHSPAVFAWQSGENQISHNHIHDTPYSGIVVSGRISFDRKGLKECSKTVRWAEITEEDLNIKTNWYGLEKYLHARKNIVSFNHIHDVMQVMADGNAVYISGCGAGNLVKNNYVHDIRHHSAVAALRTDDDQFETILTENVVRDAVCPAFILKHENNVYTNNIMINCGSIEKNPKWGYFIAMRCGPVNGSVIERNVFYTGNPAEINAYECGPTYGEPAYLKDCKADYNLYFSPEDPHWQKQNLAEWRSSGVEHNSRLADPRFVDIEQGNYSFAPGSPALEMGIRPVDISTVGIRKR